MCKVSALVSAYYAEDYLTARLLNLFGHKKHIDLEIVVICQEGSIEEKIAKPYNVKIVTTSDVPTIGKAWNLGIEASSGEYLAIANTDDLHAVDGLKCMADTLDDNPDIGLVFAQVDIDDGFERKAWQRINHDTGEVKDIKNILAERCIIGPMPMWRKSLHDDFGLFDEKYIVASDYGMWYCMARGGVRFFYIAESLGVYRNRPDSLEHSNSHMLKMENERVRA